MKDYSNFSTIVGKKVFNFFLFFFHKHLIEFFWVFLGLIYVLEDTDELKNSQIGK